MASSSNITSGLDIHTANICYTRYNPDERVIINVGIQPLSMDTNDHWKAVSEGLTELFSDFKVPGENIITSLPGEYAIIKKVAIERDETSIEDTIDWELSQNIIGAISEYVYDFELLKDDGAKDLKNYLVVGYRNDAVTRITKLLKDKKLNPVIIDLDVFALINLFELNYGELLNSPMCIILSDEIKTKLILTVKGTFIDIETITHTTEMQTPEGFSGMIPSAVSRLCAYNGLAATQKGMRMFLSGEYFAQQETAGQVCSALKNAEVLNPFRKITCKAGIEEDKLRVFSPLLGVSVGLALRTID